MINNGDARINVIPRIFISWGDFEAEVLAQTPIEIILKTEMIALNAHLHMHRAAIEDWERFLHELGVLKSEDDLDKEEDFDEEEDFDVF